jgi:hypothetical protein
MAKKKNPIIIITIFTNPTGQRTDNNEQPKQAK